MKIGLGNSITTSNATDSSSLGIPGSQKMCIQKARPTYPNYSEGSRSRCARFHSAAPCMRFKLISLCSHGMIDGAVSVGHSHIPISTSSRYCRGCKVSLFHLEAFVSP